LDSGYRQLVHSCDNIINLWVSENAGISSLAEEILPSLQLANQSVMAAVHKSWAPGCASS